MQGAVSRKVSRWVFELVGIFFRNIQGVHQEINFQDIQGGQHKTKPATR